MKSDIEIAQGAQLYPITEVAQLLGITTDDLELYGNYKAKISDTYLKKIENNKNKYSIYKKLYIDKQTAKPIKLEVQDINQKILVYMLYNEIKINSTNKEQILALN